MAGRVTAWIVAALYVGMGYMLIERAMNGPALEPSALQPMLVIVGVVVMLVGGVCALIGLVGDEL